MSLKDFKPIIIIGIFLGLVIVSVYVVSAYWPKYDEYFFELGLLGEEGKAESYFPSNSSLINQSTPMSWLIYVHNHMGSQQDVSIRAKILNSTMEAPDDRGHEPSPEPVFLEIPVSLSVDETVLIPYSWSVSDAEIKNGTIVKELVVNGESVEVDVKSFSDARFRIVFELWVYDQDSGEFVFGWYSKGEFYSASIYMWFELNLSV